MAKSLEVHGDEEQIFGWDWYDPDCHATEILDAKNEKVDIDDLVYQLMHLSATQNYTRSLQIFQSSLVFGGTLVYLHRRFHIGIMPGAKPKHARSYTIARIHLEAFRNLITLLQLEYSP